MGYNKSGVHCLQWQAYPETSWSCNWACTTDCLVGVVRDFGARCKALISQSEVFIYFEKAIAGAKFKGCLSAAVLGGRKGRRGAGSPAGLAVFLHTTARSLRFYTCKWTC